MFLAISLLSSFTFFTFDLFFRDFRSEYVLITFAFSLVTFLGLVFIDNIDVVKSSFILGILLATITLTQVFFITEMLGSINFSICIAIGFFVTLSTSSRLRNIFNVYILLFFIAAAYSLILRVDEIGMPIPLIIRRIAPFAILYFIVTFTALHLKNLYIKQNDELSEAHRSIRQQSMAMEHYNEKLEDQQEQLAVVNRLLKSSLDEKSSYIEEVNQSLIDLAHKNAHHVRGPVARILGLFNLIKSDPDNREMYLDLIKSEAESLDGIIHEFGGSIDMYIAQRDE